MKTPNLIYIFADQLRYSSVGFNGDIRAKTPNLDKLRGQSVNLCNAVSGHPVCAPYRASLFTGKYTSGTGMVINEIRLQPEHRCFAHELNENGVTTSYIGKWHLYAPEWGNHYDAKNSFVPPGPYRLGFDGYFAHYGFHHNYYGAAAYYHLDSPEKIYHDRYEPDAQTDMAVEQLKVLKNKGEPFAMFLSLGTPHDPWMRENVPGEYLERFKDTEFSLPENYLTDNDPHADAWACLNERERTQLAEWMRVYYAMVANLDDNIGRLLSEIDTLGLDENTVLVFTSDHGEMFGAHGRRAKNIFYEEAVRVPFLIRWKGHTEENSICDVCLNTPDIMPTLLGMMGLPVPDTAEGVNLCDVILNLPGADEPDGALMMSTGATARFEDGHEWRAWRTKRYTYAVYLSDKRELLFDNVNDPSQKRNLSEEPEYTSIKSALKTAMNKKMKALGDTFETCCWYERNWTKDRIIIKTAGSKNNIF